MAESSSGQEKTEQATPKKLQDARLEGQIPRSRELTTLITLWISGISLLLIGDTLMSSLKDILRDSFTLGRTEIFNQFGVMTRLSTSMRSGLYAILPFFAILFITACLAPALLGGWTFSVKALQIKLDRLDPIKGIKKVFSWNGVSELLKALAKLLLVSTVGYWLLNSKIAEFTSWSKLDIESALSLLGTELIWIFLLLSSALIVVVLFDIPFQIWNFNKQQKMTLQEIKEENKETDGSPEQKGKRRALQREVSQRRMMDAVPKADVVITNPSHFSIALRYDQNTQSAPIIVAMGKDLVALQIRRIAVAHDVEILESPPLARSLYYHGEIGKEIPAGLYLAVAQVLAYIYQLKQFQTRGGIKPDPLTDVPVPNDLRKD